MNTEMQIKQLLTQLSVQEKLALIEQIVQSIGIIDSKPIEKVKSQKEHPILEMAGIWSEETAEKMENHLSDARKIDYDEW